MSPSQPSTHRDGVEGGGGGGGCPVVRNSSKAQQEQDQQEQQPSWDLSRLLWWKKKNEEKAVVGSTTGKAATTKVVEGSIADNDAGGGCPVVHQHQQNRRTPSIPPASVEESAKHSQRPQYRDQVVPLSTHRVISTIPRGGEAKMTQTTSTTPTSTKEEVVAPTTPSTPSHQPIDANKWVYPSEQQFYNAMRRKGWSSVDETTIPDVVRIHNAVNERGWLEIQKWESLRSSSSGTDSDSKQPKLVKFMGRPNDMSPKAWFNSKVLWYKPPFDRHDWYVESGGGEEGGNDTEVRRYVIDFYNGNDDNESTGFTNVMYNWITGTKDETTTPTSTSARRPPSMYLDVRPALDSPNALYDRTKMFVWDAFPGLCSAFFGGGVGGFGSSFGGGNGGSDGGVSPTNNTTATAASSSSDNGGGGGGAKGGGGGAV